MGPRPGAARAACARNRLRRTPTTGSARARALAASHIPNAIAGRDRDPPSQRADGRPAGRPRLGCGWTQTPSGLGQLTRTGRTPSMGRATGPSTTRYCCRTDTTWPVSAPHPESDEDRRLAGLRPTRKSVPAGPLRSPVPLWF